MWNLLSALLGKVTTQELGRAAGASAGARAGHFAARAASTKFTPPTMTRARAARFATSPVNVPAGGFRITNDGRTYVTNYNTTK